MSNTASYCEQCGAPISPGQFFCEQCGARVMDRSNAPEVDARGTAKRRSGRHGKARQEGLRWTGTVPAFSRFREGGPGRPITLALAALACLLLLGSGIARSASAGVDGGGPALILIGVWLLLSLAFWILLKAGLRKRSVTFVVDDKGAAVKPSAGQRALDRRMQTLTRVAFWLSLKGGQWATWAPFVRWADVKRIDIKHNEREILLRGGAWDVRLVCTAENFDDVRAVIKRLAPSVDMS